MLFGLTGLHDAHDHSVDDVLALYADLLVVELLCLGLLSRLLLVVHRGDD